MSEGPQRPEPRLRTARAAEIVEAASGLLESEGAQSLTMRRIGSLLDIKAPSIYKHFADKRAIELAIIEGALFEIGDLTHMAVDETELLARRPQIVALLSTYRSQAALHPAQYRLATSGELQRTSLLAGLEEWAGNPWYRVTGDSAQAQALWSMAHGMVILEIDGRYPTESDLEAMWAAGAAAFASSEVAAPH